MKPTNQREREVTALSLSLGDLSAYQYQYCIRAYDKTKKDKTRRVYVTILQAYHGYQVVRTFRVEYVKGEYFVRETMQNWYDEKGTRTIIARPMLMGGRLYDDPYCYSRDMSIKKPSCYGNSYYQYTDKVLVTSVTPELRQHGYKAHKSSLCEQLVVEQLLTQPHYETLAKACFWGFFDASCVNEHWDSIRCCIRNGYNLKYKDVSDWRDMVANEKKLGLDITSPKWVCPANLKAMHDMVEKRVERKMVKEYREKQREQLRLAMEYDDEYKKEKGKYFGVLINVGAIEIRPLSSVEEFFEEGTAMHHCVYTNEYYKEAESLILTARIGDKRVATIELSLKDFKVRQCRSACNGVPEHKDDIVSAIEGSSAIREIALCA